jgi:site-specific DNA recombinase
MEVKCRRNLPSFSRKFDLETFATASKKGIVTKRRNTKVRKFNSGIPFTYGPLAHFLKNRLYVGETGHKEKWFPGGHAAFINKKDFRSSPATAGV